MAMHVARKGYNSEINITPYIDILLVLLIIFMVATPMKKYDQQVRIPKPAIQQPKQVDSESVVLEVDLNHDLRINQTPVTFENLQTTLVNIFSARVNKNMFIRGDAKLDYGFVFKILDLAKQSGVADIALLDKATTGDKGSGGSAAKASNGDSAESTKPR
jgi:biopolymer transport protein ExbD